MDFQSAMETFAEAWVAANTQTPLTEAAETQVVQAFLDAQMLYVPLRITSTVQPSAHYPFRHLYPYSSVF
ncbi:hypothetical protein X975_09334, partial [Stegodyphus mimosarum]